MAIDIRFRNGTGLSGFAKYPVFYVMQKEY
jgi:hypothetical protein